MSDTTRTVVRQSQGTVYQEIQDALDAVYQMRTRIDLQGLHSTLEQTGRPIEQLLGTHPYNIGSEYRRRRNRLANLLAQRMAQGYIGIASEANGGAYSYFNRGPAQEPRHLLVYFNPISDVAFWHLGGLLPQRPRLSPGNIGRFAEERDWERLFRQLPNIRFLPH
ncbi:MAG TPA: hypothetical protein VLF67_04365 [Candidatus Saccharimonas sp.]|nr:hypothetical protein [Candidatus Saccharimonas sp.]